VVDMLHSPLLVVELQREGGHIADGVHSGNARLEECIGLRSQKAQEISTGAHCKNKNLL
jgi:hypothetical protein